MPVKFVNAGTSTEPIDSITPHPLNPNEGDVETIRGSIQENGFYGFVVCQKSSRRILIGEHRWKGLKEEGAEEVPILWVDVTDKEAIDILLADNRTGELAKRIPEKLAEALAQRSKRKPLRATGYTEDHVRKLKEALARQKGLDIEEDETPPVPEQPKSKRGEVYHLGPHRLMCGDSTVRDDVAKLFEEPQKGKKKPKQVRAGMVFMDPPYAIYGSSSGLSASVTDDKIVRPFFRDALAMAQDFTEMFAHVYVCCDWRSWPSWWEMAKATALAPKNLIVWDKKGSGLGNMWSNTHELVGFFCNMPPQKTMSGNRPTGLRQVLRPNVVRHNRPTGEERHHNAAKPVGLVAEFIEAGVDEGGIVLDLFGGSGTTMISAYHTKRVCYMMEMEPAWCDVIRTRYAKLVQDPTLEP